MHFWKALGAVVVLTCVLILMEFLRVTILLRLFHFRPSFDFFLWFFLSHVIGVASGVPSGLGVKDVALGIYLKGFLSVPEIALFLILCRLTGEVFSAFLGWCVAGQHALGVLTGPRERLPLPPK